MQIQAFAHLGKSSRLARGRAVGGAGWPQIRRVFVAQAALSSELRARVETAAGQVQRTLTTQARDLHRSLFNRTAKAFGHKVSRLIGRPA